MLIALIGSMATAAQYEIKLTRAHLDSAETLHVSFEVSNESDAPVYINQSDLFYEVLVFSYDNEIVRPDVKINKRRRPGIDKYIIEKNGNLKIDITEPDFLGYHLTPDKKCKILLKYGWSSKEKYKGVSPLKGHFFINPADIQL